MQRGRAILHTLSSIQNAIRAELLQANVARPAKPGYCQSDATVDFYFSTFDMHESSKFNQPQRAAYAYSK
jgi:hypothetical protein